MLLCVTTFYTVQETGSMIHTVPQYLVGNQLKLIYLKKFCFNNIIYTFPSI